MGDNLKVVWFEFTTLSQAVCVVSVITQHGQAGPHLELKTRPKFCAVFSSLAIAAVLITPVKKV